MDGLSILGIILVVYGVLVIVFALLKPRAIWNMGKIQIFVKLFGEKGTSIFLLVFALIVLAIGIWLLL